MLRLTRFIRPFLLLIVVAIALLFVQAMADLTLPEYMGQIVNVGIQQSGIEDAVPNAIRERTMNNALLFMTEEEQAAVLDAYTLISPDSSEADRYIDEYPVLADEPVYVLNDIDAETFETLNPVFGRALLIVSGIRMMVENPDQIPEGMLDSGFELPDMPEGTDPFALLGALPDAMRQPLLEGVRAQFDTMEDSMIVQTAVIAVKDEYAALGIDTDSLQTNYILSTGAVMVLLTLLSAAAAVTVGFLSARTAAGIARNLRHAIFERVEQFSSTEFNRFSTASLITRTTNDVTQIQMVIVLLLQIVVYAPILGVGGIIKALETAANMSWIIGVGVVALLALIGVLFTVALPKFKIVQSLTDRLNLVTREHLSGIMVVRAFNTQAFEEGRFEKANRDLTDTNLFVSRAMVTMMPAMMFIMNGLTVLIIWVGAQQVAAATIQVGDMMAFMQYAIQVVMSFLMLSMMFIFLPRAWVSGDRIAEVLETEPAINDPAQPKTFSAPFSGTVEFKNVSFRYPGAEEYVLHDITFTAQPGQTTAFVGSTGSGKSTVINLIPRFFDVTEGEILVDGIDIREVQQHDLRDLIGYVPQRANLFSGTIESNLRYADENASADTLSTAVSIAQAEEFVSTMQDGLDTEIAQGGGNVSGGQRQRLSIARALVKNPPIYIFDDSFSALDFKTDAALRRDLKSQTGDSTVLIVAQRISTIKNAEQIVVLDRGRIVGKGTHSELLEDCEVYREIAVSQLGMEELER
jgi:ATP-binding cassette subfamily B multidrug efflux pump